MTKPSPFNLYIVPYAGAWAIREGQDGPPRCIVKSREAGVRRARGWAKREARRVVVHGPEGDVQRMLTYACLGQREEEASPSP